MFPGLAVSAFLGWATPRVVITFTFLEGIVWALNGPVFLSVVPSLVPHAEPSPALALNSVQFNSHVGDCDPVLVCASAAARTITSASAAGRSQGRGGGTSPGRPFTQSQAHTSQWHQGYSQCQQGVPQSRIVRSNRTHDHAIQLRINSEMRRPNCRQ